ncbi:unnamed protein product [Ranitomeya imitator]|uniref:Uncharacterized protein n=1 Tax=Ranitomeya imitator TaxID=111125 RepID=A0ABN9LYJ6_9NEOB|nr:unnamed protein product [Ranitomeya imitator]
MSPDLNPIEHLWRDLKMAVWRRHPSNIRDLEQFVKEEWSKIPTEHCKKLIDGYRKRFPVPAGQIPSLRGAVMGSEKYRYRTLALSIFTCSSSDSVSSTDAQQRARTDYVTAPFNLSVTARRRCRRSRTRARSRLYYFYNHWVMQVLTYVCITVDLALAIFEEPAVYHLPFLLNLIDLMIYGSLLIAQIPSVRWSRILRPIYLVNFAESRQIRRAFRSIRNTLPEILYVFLLFMFSVLIFSLMAQKLFGSRNTCSHHCTAQKWPNREEYRSYKDCTSVNNLSHHQELQGESFHCCQKAPGRPRKTSKRQDRILNLFRLRDRTTSSAELAQEWQQAGVSAPARTVRRRLFERGLVSRRAAKKPLLSRKNIRDRLIFCKRYREWTAEDWGKVIFSDESPFRLFGTSGKQLIRRRRGERSHQSCLMPTVKHPETIHVWGCFSAKGIGSLTVLPKNTAMNKEWYQNVLQEQLLPTVQEQFGTQQRLFQHDGAPCHKAKVITKWLMEQNIEILGPWPGNSPDLNPIENLWSIIKRRVDKQKPTNSGKIQALIMQEWTAISQDLVQKLIESMPGRIAEALLVQDENTAYSRRPCSSPDTEGTLDLAVFSAGESNPMLTVDSRTGKLVTAEGEPYFENYLDGAFNLYVLVTTANSPDVMMPAYDYNWWYSVFFIAYIILNTYIFMSVFLAVVYNNYRKHLKNEIRKLAYMKRRKMADAFNALKVQEGSEFVISESTWLKLVKLVAPDISNSHRELLLRVSKEDNQRYVGEEN